MSRELSDYKGSVSTFKMYLQYCPDAVTYLLDRCLNIECMEQVHFQLVCKITILMYFFKNSKLDKFSLFVFYSLFLMFQVQGCIFLDFFLFDPNCPMRCSSELAMVKILVQSGKEKFIIHPLVEIFMKMKWKKTWFLYWIYLTLFSLFFFALTAYSLAHYGALTAYSVPSINGSMMETGYKFDYGDQKTGWW